jgi:hypothetical protein
MVDWSNNGIYHSHTKAAQHLRVAPLQSRAGNLVPESLFRYDVLGLRTFLSLGHFHRDLLTFFQGFESFHLDRSVVYEYILTAFSLDETKSLVIIEPLYGSFNSFA